ncbi:MAG: HEAT repeat domain-containing protein [Ignavibacteriales bacterium]|nr:HEAT repeat domain-containing protein [Ignavibacteriales bacterium]
MKHKRFEEQVHLYFYSELAGEELREFDHHLSVCSRCRNELEKMKRLARVLNKFEPLQVSDPLLQEARQELSQSLKNERKKKSFLDTIIDTIYDVVVLRYKVAIGGAALLVGGMLIGYFTFRTTEVSSTTEPVVEKEQVTFTEALNDDSRISNVQFISLDKTSGEVEFTFEASMPVHMKGRVSDPTIQKVLAYALISDQNPGVRLQSVNALASEAHTAQPDAEVMEALISAVRFDKNPGVRKEALDMLGNYTAEREQQRRTAYRCH